MGNKRYTRKTNGFSKKIENHVYATALQVMHYIFAKIHTKLRVTPAMEVGITDRVWSLEDMARLVEASSPKKRGPYKPRIKHYPRLEVIF